jgi:retron-type reverse transcriptase
MKTFNYLFEEIVSFENLLLAAKKAQKGKRYNKNVAAFHFHLEDNLLQLQEELNQKTYRPGAYRTFNIYDPKQRMISAAPYRDRVVHHALCNVIEPLFEKTFIYDSYANRKEKGTHKAIERYQQYARRYPYVLKCDIRKFFPSIDHAILKQEIRRKITCRDTLWLVDTIIDNSNQQEEHLQWFPGDDLFSPTSRKRGLPIGNLTSQFWGNVYLNRFDHFIKEELRVPGYIRYVDDFVLFADTKQELNHWKSAVSDYLATLRLIPHPNKTQIHQTEGGVPFLGFRVFPCHRYVRKEKVKRYRRYLKKNLKLRAERKLSPQTLEDQLNAWLGHIRFGESKRLEYRVFWYLWNSGVNLFYTPSGSWRVLEQQ